jgi:hypothetical protein
MFRPTDPNWNIANFFLVICNSALELSSSISFSVGMMARNIFIGACLNMSGSPKAALMMDYKHSASALLVC